MHYPDSDVTWRITNREFTVMATAFLIEAEPTVRTNGHIAHMIAVAGPENAVRSITAHAIGKMSSQPAILRAVDTEGRLVERFDILKPLADRYGNVKVSEWTRPTPRALMGAIYEATAYSKALDARYVPMDNPGYQFVATADDPRDLPEAYYRFARKRLPSPMLPEWAEPVYREGIRQGRIKELNSYGIAGALNAWTPDDLSETIRVMGLCGRLKRPARAGEQRDEHVLEAAD